MTQEEMENRVAGVMSRSIPIVATSSLICSLCFVLTGGAPFIGVKMPVIEIFARHAGLAIFFDTFFYLLIMLPLFQYDAIQELKGKVYGLYELSNNTKNGMITSGIYYGSPSPITYFQKYTAIIFMNEYARCTMCFSFVLSLTFSIYFASKLSYGFDQTMALSKNSYITSHFRLMNEVLNTGPPVYFSVVGNVDWSNWDVQKKFCSLPGCERNSLGNTLRSLTSFDLDDSRTNSYFTGDVFNWIDSYLLFLDTRGTCCKKYKNGTTCPLDDPSSECMTCIGNGKIFGHQRATPEEFKTYLDHFLNSKPGRGCAHGGRATAKHATSLDINGEICGAHFMTFFRKLNISSSIELYTAMSFARFVASEITANIGMKGVTVFAYSTFFPYYEQYSSMGQTLYTLAVLVLLVVFVTTSLFLNVDYKGSLITVLVLLSAFFHLMSWMYLWGIDMNVLSATNMAMSLGITVEFVIQVLHGFHNSTKEKSVDRAISAVVNNGSTIISGILPAILLTAGALWLADSQILRTYFCYQLIGVAFVSTIHGVIFLPAILSIVATHKYHEIGQNDEDDISEGKSDDSPELDSQSESDIDFIRIT